MKYSQTKANLTAHSGNWTIALQPQLHTGAIYTKYAGAVSVFYERYFKFIAHREDRDRPFVLSSPNGGNKPASSCEIAKLRQALVKLVFNVADLVGFCAKCARDGLVFGGPHQADGYVFANAKDPRRQFTGSKQPRVSGQITRGSHSTIFLRRILLATDF